jgi:hypothetical protein
MGQISAMNMSYKHSITIIALLFIGGEAAPRERKNASDQSPIPKKMIVRVGGGIYYPRDGGKPEALMRRSYIVELRGKDLHYRVIKEGGKPNVEKVVTPTEEQWELFWKEIENARLWSWSDEYYNYDVKDGTFWFVEISYRGRSIKSRGSNSYPSEGDVSKPNPGAEYSQPFSVILRGVRNLLGGLEFE